MSARAEIEALIPHRPPFLFVDEIADGGAGWLATRWRVPADADWFRGHYPGEPVTPGVLICEHVFQSAALLVAQQGLSAQAGIPVLARIESARFRRIVRPGELLDTRVELVERLGPACVLSGAVACGGERVQELRFVLARTAGGAA